MHIGYLSLTSQEVLPTSIRLMMLQDGIHKSASAMNSA